MPLALLWLAAAMPCVAAADALQVIDACVAKLDASLDVGYARIAARCPDLTPALTSGPQAAWLPADWQRADNQLSAGGLLELRTLLSRAAAARPVRSVPLDTGQVAPVLAGLRHGESTSASWWSRFKDWLRSVLDARREPERGWLLRLLDRINLSERSAEVIAWGSFALLVVLALGVAVNELRIAGWPGSWRRRRTARAPDALRRCGITLAQIERAAAREQPALLLELLATRLAELQLLPPARALTARELTERARLTDQPGRTRLAALAQVCERIRFADEDVDEASRTGALNGGRELLNSIEAGAAAAPRG